MYNGKKGREMVSNFKVSRLGLLSHSLSLLWVLGATSALAQITRPDAGSLMQPAAPPAAPAKSAPLDVLQEVRPAPVTPGDIKVKVASFKISGNTVFDEATLKALLSDLVGKELDLADLDQAAGTISQYYRQRGYSVASAYLPAQVIASGVLEIAVIEGRLGAIKFARSGVTRLAEWRAQELMAGSPLLGVPIQKQNIERGLMRLNDMSGVEFKSTLVPGATPGTSELLVEVTEGALLTGNVDADNYGNEYTGAVRIGTTANINNPGGIGDQITVRGGLAGVSSMRYGRLSYSLPVGNLGTKLGLAYARMNYKLGGDFALLNASGQSWVTSIFLMHPLIRSRNTNVYVTTTYDSKQLTDELSNRNVADKSIKVISTGFSVDMRDSLGGSGLSMAGLTLTGGELHLGDFPGNDLQTARTDGSYSKLSYNFSRLQRIDDSWSFYAAFSGQNARKNLDSSEKFVLGGMGVRAYPQGEAAGDSGSLLNLEARYNLPGFKFGNLQFVGFIDTGHVTLHNATWDGWQPIGSPNFPNSYSLSGAGIGLNHYKADDFSVRSSLAWKVGNNPGADALGRDADSKDSNVRFWLQVTKNF